jgi:hypothetical protein
VKNPYALDKLWPKETHEAYISQPLYKGYIVSLFSVKDKDLPRMEQQWREWCAKHPKSLWPVHIHQWAEHKKRLPKE